MIGIRWRIYNSSYKNMETKDGRGGSLTDSTGLAKPCQRLQKSLTDSTKLAKKDGRGHLSSAIIWLIVHNHDEAV